MLCPTRQILVPGPWRQRTQTVGAVIPTMENSIFARGIQAFQEELSNHGFTLLVASSSYKPDREEEQIKNLIARGAEGLLLIGYDRNPVIYEFLRNRKIPVLVTWAFDPALNLGQQLASITSKP